MSIGGTIKSLPEPEPLGCPIIHLKVDHLVFHPEEKDKADRYKEKQQDKQGRLPDGHGLPG